MIPPGCVPETPPSERRLYEAFREKLPEDWTVIHSQRFLLSGKRGAREGELDFVVLDPARGALGIEVKGGLVSRTEAGWVSRDRRGDDHPIQDPGRQASRAVHALRAWLEQADGFGGRGYRCPFGWGVALPDTDWPGDFGPDLPRELVLDHGALFDLRRELDRMFDYWKQSPLTRKAADALVAALVERIPPASTLALLIREWDETLERLTGEQMGILDALAAHRRAAIEGAAGTGKTVLAMEKARRLATTGARVLLLCFNRPLAKHLERGAEGFRVATFHDFCRRLAERAGLRFEPGGEAFWDEDAPELLLRALERLPDERYDAIVVDEGQDFLPSWWDALDLALSSSEGTLYAFYDPNQNLYDGGPPAALKVLETRLVVNCRNTKSIAEYAGALVNCAAVVKPGAPQGEPVEEISCRSGDELVRRVGRRLGELVDTEGIPPERVAIISTRTLRNSPFAESRAGRFELAPLPEWDDAGERRRRGRRKRITFDTLYRFKGLERDAVILLDLPGASTAAHLHVAASRAKHLLIVARLRASR